MKGKEGSKVTLQPLLPLLSQVLHVLPTPRTGDFKLLSLLLCRIFGALLPASPLPRRLTFLPSEPPAFHLRSLRALVAPPIRRAAPLALAVLLLHGIQHLLIRQGEPHGRRGPQIGGDGVPGGPEPARDVRRQHDEADEEARQRHDGRGADAWMGEVVSRSPVRRGR